MMNSSTLRPDMSRARFVAVDWGTSSFRAWPMSADGMPLAQSRGPEGMLHCMTEGFEPVLRQHLERLGAPAHLPILISGMAGARQGWKEAPYLQTPTRPDELHRGAVKIDALGDVRILPGIAQRDASRPDVMRGEETQLLGAVRGDFSGLVCIPGTHSKWIRLETGCVMTFSTYLTGELFSVLGKHSILAHAVEPDQPPLPDAPAFRSGLDAGMHRGLQEQLFRLRAAQLLGFEQRGDGAARLSGLLIGAELADAGRQYGGNGPILLIAAGMLGQLYEAALRQAGWDVETVDAEKAAQAGLARAAANLWGEHF
ncbi:2-dehydro-3-deoxygalactonokinase [Noviherbaspirillum pedocola]|uniref:2-dehydro-3-deoxygalactonokinase n=1 Tax=Noviherbaspirillum pedocola TaxID=2801341 RepID=A0A934STW8_9BURK|nr:2-dehydro-3-deoxygalactonokinase [Noviherbaspirillum pedocola]MBK4735365.1 2-dehydro-3-deoxygalactonokinase [Noviherbaspirillum pedocola]